MTVVRRLSRIGVSVLLLSLLGFATQCATGRQELRPLAPLSAASPDAAWDELLRIRRAEPRLASYSSIRVESGGSKQSFRATIATDEKGRLRVDAFTPMGTAAFTLYVDGSESTMIDHMNRTWWRGPFSTAARSLGLPASLDARGLAMIAFGLPASALDAGDRGERITQDGVRYLVERSGIAEARADEWTAQFDASSFPAAAVTIVSADGARSVSVRHIDVGAATRAVDEPRIDRSYRCCVEPATR